MRGGGRGRRYIKIGLKLVPIIYIKLFTGGGGRWGGRTLDNVF